MKKGNHAVLAVTFMFVCFMVGFFVGKVTTHSHIAELDSPKVIDQPAPLPVQSTTDPSVSDGRININTATSHQLQMLPDIGEVLAERIIEYRTQNGPFSTIEDLVLVKGIGDQRMEELRQYITVGG